MIDKTFWSKDRLLIELVKSGNKPACNVGISQRARRLAEKQGLVMCLGYNATGAAVSTRASCLIISRDEPVVALSLAPLLDMLKDYQHLIQEIQALYNTIQNKVIAEASNYLATFPRLNDQGQPYPDNQERPAVAALSGLLFGYKPCCIQYYIKTRYFTGVRHGELAGELADHYIGIVCEACEEKGPPF